jgi:hypothetical protein
MSGCEREYLYSHPHPSVFFHKNEIEKYNSKNTPSRNVLLRNEHLFGKIMDPPFLRGAVGMNSNCS